MITCPNCQTTNDPASRFCIRCGQPLATQPTPPGGLPAIPRSAIYRRNLAVATGALLIALFLVWVFRSIFLRLSFVQNLVVPEIPFAIANLVDLLAFLIAVILLFGYMQTLRSQWAQAFPNLAGLLPALLAILWVILLSLSYKALVPLIVAAIEDPRDFILALQVLFAVLALILLTWAGVSIYRQLPSWLSSVRFEALSAPRGRICPVCGQDNPPANNYCGRCGTSFVGAAPE